MMSEPRTTSWTLSEGFSAALGSPFALSFAPRGVIPLVRGALTAIEEEAALRELVRRVRIEGARGGENVAVRS